MKFCNGVVLAMGKVRNTVLGLYPSSRNCMKRNKSMNGVKLKKADHAVTMTYFVVDSNFDIESNFKY